MEESIFSIDALFYKRDAVLLILGRTIQYKILLWPQRALGEGHDLKMRTWLQKLKMFHKSRTFLFPYAKSGNVFLKKFEFSIRFENLKIIWVKSPTVLLLQNQRTFVSLHSEAKSNCWTWNPALFKATVSNSLTSHSLNDN